MNDPDVWAAFESTPAAIEPVANRDNSLQGFQRRLLEECGEKLGETREDLKEAAALVDRARRAGADVADAVYIADSSESVSVRLGKLEDVERSESEHIGLPFVLTGVLRGLATIFS